MPVLPKAVTFAHHIVAEVLRPGAVAVDATAGRGHDTLFLASRVGPLGRVYAFDLQREAIASTRERLEAAGALAQTVLIEACHSTMREYVTGEVSAVMFNLGYLPGGDHRCITRPGTTVEAIAQGLALLRAGGIMTVVVYPGHPGGEEERQAVENYTRQLPQRDFSVILYKFLNQVNQPPQLIAIEKLGRRE